MLVLIDLILIGIMIAELTLVVSVMLVMSDLGPISISIFDCDFDCDLDFDFYFPISIVSFLCSNS